jgi:hypothetical protein
MTEKKSNILGDGARMVSAGHVLRMVLLPLVLTVNPKGLGYGFRKCADVTGNGGASCSDVLLHGGLRALRGGCDASTSAMVSHLSRINHEISMEIEDMAIRRRRFIREETQVLDFFKPKVEALTRPKSKTHRRASGCMTEREEDEALLRRTEDEEAGNLVTQKIERMLPLTTQPRLLEGGELRDYQLEGLNWLASLYVNGASGILADEMGLGKTVQTVAMLALLMECGARGPFLVLAPKSTLSNWRSEFAKWLPAARVLLLQGSKDERQVMMSEVLRPY